MNQDQRREALAAAAAKIVGQLYPEDVVEFATRLISEGVEVPSLLELAMLPNGRAELRRDEVLALFDQACIELGVVPDSSSHAGWIHARTLASAIIETAIEPGPGAAAIWPLWELTGIVPGTEPSDMLQLYDEWEGSVGAARSQAEQRIRQAAESVVDQATSALKAMSLRADSNPSLIGARDVMPLLLRVCPRFLPKWWEIEAENVDEGSPDGRLHYLDAGDLSRHVVELQLDNWESQVAGFFSVVEQLHLYGDPYVKELATIGYIEGVQTSAGHAGLDHSVFEPHLGPENRRWWRGVEAFWAGNAPTVQPVD